MNWKKMIQKGRHYDLAYAACFDPKTIKAVNNFMQGEPLQMFNLFVEEAKEYYAEQQNTKPQNTPERKTKLNGLSDYYLAEELFILNNNIQLGDVVRVITNTEWLHETSWKKTNTFMEPNLTEQDLKEMIQ